MTHGPTIGDVEGALLDPVCVTMDDSVALAVERMQDGDFDALPVINDRGRAVGLVSWRSIVEAGRPQFVREASVRIVQFSPDTPLLDTLRDIGNAPAVVIQESTGPVLGIVAAADVVIAFGRLAGPFLALGEIERRMRAILVDRVRPERLAEAIAHFPGRRLDATSLGDMIGLWRRFEIAESLREPELYERLEDARYVRNSVMHFHREGPTSDELDRLDDTLGRLRDHGPED